MTSTEYVFFLRRDPQNMLVYIHCISMLEGVIIIQLVIKFCTTTSLPSWVQHIIVL
jgi:hypothetical protein